MRFVREHLRAFAAINPPPQLAIGRKPMDYANHVGAGLGRKFNLPVASFGRSDLDSFCRDQANQPEACFLGIMAWGGKRIPDARRCWKTRDRWRDLLDQFRTDHNLHRRSAYRILRDLRDRKELPGIGPAFYTKLIFFLRPHPDGYIMDQWTAKSVNLLRGEPVVELNRQGVVTDRNAEQTYEHFCLVVDELAARLGCSGDQIEQRLFSHGQVAGQERGPWRKYVIRHTH